MIKRRIIKPLIYKGLDYILKRSSKIEYLDYILERPDTENRIFEKYIPDRLESRLDYFLNQPIIKEGIFQKFIPDHLNRVAELVIALSNMSECYSQEGEDLFLFRTFGTGYKGFYVDVGSHHPRRFSNTYLLYKFGWRGINIDATPGSMEEFSILRPDDINIESAVTNSSDPRTFFIFAEPALNTFSEEVAQDYLDLGYALDRREIILGQSLASILDEHLQSGQEIDLLSVDVEGDEYGVLQSNNWSRYRPKTVLLEILDVSLAAIAETPVGSLLRKEGYAMVAKFTNTAVFQLEKKN